jgi:hypothetical protein
LTLLEADAWLLRLDGEGNIIWQEAYPIQEFRRAGQTEDGGFMLGGSTATMDYLRNAQSFPFNSLIVKLDANGGELWHRRIQPFAGDCLVTDFIEAENGAIYFTSQIQYTSGLYGALTKLNPDGTLVWNRSLSSSSSAYNAVNTLRETDDNGIIVGIASSGNIGGDKTEDSRGGADYWAVKFEPEALGTEHHAMPTFTIVPNPVGDYLYLISNATSEFDIAIYNAAGQLVVTKPGDAFETQIAFPFASGIYFAKFTDAAGRSQTIKITKP